MKEPKTFQKIGKSVYARTFQNHWRSRLQTYMHMCANHMFLILLYVLCIYIYIYIYTYKYIHMISFTVWFRHQAMGPKWRQAQARPWAWACPRPWPTATVGPGPGLCPHNIHKESKIYWKRIGIQVSNLPRCNICQLYLSLLLNNWYLPGTCISLPSYIQGPWQHMMENYL